MREHLPTETDITTALPITDSLNRDELLEGKVLLLNKPFHWTSFDIIRKLRHIFKIKKIGHAGTLDPLATGLLIVCTGKFTKKINEYMGMEKEYTGTITLGASTQTYDLESEPEKHQDYLHISQSDVEKAFSFFVGNILQVPPAHSAIKQDGKRLYELARAGKEVRIEPRAVTIMECELTRFELPEIDFRVVCSTGTYIRSLANDVGQALGCGGYLSKLVRTRIGTFMLANALTPDQVEQAFEKMDQNG